MTKQTWLLVTLGLIASVCGNKGTLPVDVSPTYQAEEDDNITIGWDIQAKSNISVTKFLCFLQSAFPKVFYAMIDGVESPESQHHQFAGRVRLDKDALRQRRVRLHLFTATADDSGTYRCQLAANYDPKTRRWEVEASETFAVNVSRRAGGDERHVSVHTLATDGSEHTRQLQPKEAIFLAVLIGALFIFNVAAFGKFLCRRPPHKDAFAGSVGV